jgi:hypothetical protein
MAALRLGKVIGSWLDSLMGTGSGPGEIDESGWM